MKSILLSCYTLLFILTSNAIFAFEHSYGQYQPSQFSNKVVLVNWQSPGGQQRLLNSKYNNDFFQLAHHFQPQATPLYCGIATAVIVLNALRVGRIPSQEELEVQKPKVWGGDKIPYPLYSQQTFLNLKTDSIKLREIIRLENITPENENKASAFDPGLTLAQLKTILETYQLKVSLHYAEDNPTHNLKTFHKDLQAVLNEPQKFLIVNYKSNLVGQAGGGHISPVAAYERAHDSVLLLDVSSYFNPWVWIPTYDLYQAMHTQDGDHFRGYLIVEDNLSL